ncbi:unnamed protein product [Paramecium pentaurelia]|uniref:Uncharacterized protein n=1 Tax=Paramecium pentaurelia TaxID=43138 RepID=A0A8S1TGB0_9CILI|nr:unnamed protein product [Paramecium pentaurelia]
MHPKNSTPNFNVDKQSINKNSCPNRSVQNFSVYDDYQYKKVIPKLDSKDQMFHSHIFDSTETLKQQIIDLQKQIKIKELSNEQLANALFQQQQKYEELKIVYIKAEEEKRNVQKKIKEHVEKNEFNQFDMKQQQEINTLFQNENTQLKLAAVKLKDTILKLQSENKQLKDQIEALMNNPLSCERKGSSRLSFDYLLNEADQTQPIQGNSGSTLQNCEKNCICSKKLLYQQAEIKKYQNQLFEKDQLITKLTQQNNVLQKAQMKIQKCQKKQNLFGTPEIELAKQDPVLIQDDSNDTSRQLNTYLSDKKFNNISNAQESQMPLKTSSSARSVLINKSKREVEQIYKKMNQSALFTASLFSTMLDYKHLHENSSQIRSTGFNQVKQL